MEMYSHGGIRIRKTDKEVFYFSVEINEGKIKNLKDKNLYINTCSSYEDYT